MKEGPGRLQLGSDSEATTTGSTVHVRSQGQDGGSGWDWPAAHSDLQMLKGLLIGCPAFVPPPVFVLRMSQLISLGGIQNLPPKYSGLKNMGCLCSHPPL